MVAPDVGEDDGADVLEVPSCIILGSDARLNDSCFYLFAGEVLEGEGEGQFEKGGRGFEGGQTPLSITKPERGRDKYNP